MGENISHYYWYYDILLQLCNLKFFSPKAAFRHFNINICDTNLRDCIPARRMHVEVRIRVTFVFLNYSKKKKKNFKQN